MPFEGDFTAGDRITQMTPDGTGQNIWVYNPNTHEFGRTIYKKVNGRLRQVWVPGVQVGAYEYAGIPVPVWFYYFGDGVCVVKLPEGEQLEEQT
jgi:hypothetical protein